MKSRIVVSCAFVASCAISEPEVHLIPSTFEGDVLIFAGVMTGADPERERGAIVFRVPATGILVTRDRPSQGWHMARYYRVSMDGKRELLEDVPSSIHDTPENRADERPIAWFRRSGSQTSQAFPCTVTYEQYYVGSRKSLLGRKGEDNDRFERAVLENHLCR